MRKGKGLKYFIIVNFVIVNVCFNLEYLNAQPVLNSFSPVSGSIGTAVTVKGKNFSSIAQQNIVYFGAAKAVISNATDTSLIVVVPPGAIYQSIAVTTNGLTTISKQPFLVTFSGSNTMFTSNSFSAEQIISGTECPNKMDIADFDGDGKTDIAYSNDCTNGLSVARNTSLGNNISFAPATDIITNESPLGLAIFDLDGDGKKDIVTADFNLYEDTLGDLISVFKNTSTLGVISFAAKKDYLSGMGCYGIAIADLNKDGKPDIIATNEYDFPGTISVFKNISTKDSLSFAAKQNFVVGSSPRRITVCDVNNDNKPDLVVADQGSGAVTVLINTSTLKTISFITQQYATTPGSAPESISCGDLDGDNKPDLVVANNNKNGTVSILKNTSAHKNVSFVLQTDLHTEEYPYCVTITDLNGDGKPDVAVGSHVEPTDILVYKNSSSTGVISFDEPATYSTKTTHDNIIAADLNNNGKADILLDNEGDNYRTYSVLTNIQSSVLAIDSYNLKAIQSNNKIELQWQIQNDKNIAYFNIERSGDALNFSNIGKVSTIKNSSLLVNYNFTDSHIKQFNYNDNIFYRLKRVDSDGSFDYSNIASVRININSSVIIYPNPVTNVLNIDGLNASVINYLQIVNERGNIVAKQSVQNTSFYKWNLSNLGVGVYYLQIVSETKKTNIRFLKKE